MENNFIGFPMNSSNVGSGIGIWQLGFPSNERLSGDIQYVCISPVISKAKSLACTYHNNGGG